ncbi:Putative aldose 1-epimerase [Sinomonas atrocyanea]|uniref:Putative aldose 1-epimerase n=1 Tax=Sinomonas atrocyanea TaxID=37927 RepID=A0A126ZZR8_9MICC|nr:aldose 1-epimerase family protein [Sinomonas atrocyanea]AMM32091.1 Putative aldose 1-epimerase [Sinomonas atrocyanea]GEB66564.1 aldose 1-epimerase [Sinomonas atrocyanea]GGG55901.1 aldose 1-epimerase [Sinomonas atrocyanea]
MTPSPTARRAATGRQHELRRGGAVVVVTELAAGLRSYARNGVALTETYGDGQIPPGATGITLAPWANRIEDGRWTLDGKVQQLDITEPKFGHASHGLLRNTGYSVLEQTESAVALEAVVFPQHGYPFLLRHRVDYALGSDGGLSVTQTLANDSAASAPYVLGAHPYLRIGDVPTEELTLTVSGRTRLIADQRLIPRSSEPVSGGTDLRGGQPVSSLALDSGYTDLAFEDAADDTPGGPREAHAPRVARATLAAADGRRVWMWQEQTCPYTHVFVTDTFPGRPAAVALEPMSGAANAFNSGAGLGWLEPGASASIRWGIGSEL